MSALFGRSDGGINTRSCDQAMFFRALRKKNRDNIDRFFFARQHINEKNDNKKIINMDRPTYSSSRQGPTQNSHNYHRVKLLCVKRISAFTIKVNQEPDKWAKRANC